MRLTNKKIIQLYENAKIISSVKELQTIFKNRDAQYPVSFDTETTSESFNVISNLCDQRGFGVFPHSQPFVFGISMAIISKGRMYLLWARYNTSLFNAACRLLAKKYLKTAHNARYDIRVMQENGFAVSPEIDCTYTMARIYYDRRKKHSLKSLAEIICPELSSWELPVKEELKKLRTKYSKMGFEKNYVNYSFVSDEVMSKYSMMDAFFGLILWIWLNERAVWR